MVIRKRRGPDVVLVVVLLAVSATAYLTTTLGPELGWSPMVPEVFAADDGGPRRRASLTSVGRTEPRRVVPVASDEPEAAAAAPKVVKKTFSRAELEGLVRDLAHDGVRWNALGALYKLRNAGEAAVPYLEAALRSRDRQQRQLAGIILYDQIEEPSTRLIAVAVEALEHDRLPYDPGSPDSGDGGDRECWVNNAQKASRFLAEHPEAARPWLQRRLRVRDEQQRFLSACLLAWGKTDESVSSTVRVLCDHLQDNELPGDARVAASALASMGKDILPQLRVQFSASDEQARSILGFLIDEAENPIGSEAEAKRRIEKHGLRRYINLDRSSQFWRTPLVGSVPMFGDRDAGIEPAPAH